MLGFSLLPACSSERIGAKALKDCEKSFHGTCGPAHGSRAAGMVRVVVVGSCAAAAATGFKRVVPIGIAPECHGVRSPTTVWWHGRASHHSIPMSTVADRFTVSPTCQDPSLVQRGPVG